MKGIWLILLFILVSSCDPGKGWTENNLQSFINTCIEENRVSIGEEKVKQYCQCMQDSVKAQYPNYRDVEKLTMSRNQEISNNCLPKGWSADEKTMFMKSCADTRQEMGDTPDQARIYCDCMMRKIQDKYPDITKAGSIPNEEMRSMAQECIRDRNK